MAKYIKDDNDCKLLPEYERVTRSKIRGKAVECIASIVPQDIAAERKLYIRVPKLEQDACLVPGTLRLTAKLKNKNKKSWFLNNISALLHKEDRATRVNEGFASENVRKLMSGDDSGSGTGSTQNVKDKFLADTYKDEIVIPLGHILENQGLYGPYGVDFNIDFEITLPLASKVMVAQSSQSVAGYELENLQLKYKKIRNADLYSQSIQSHSVGRSLPYHYVELYKTLDWANGSTRENIRINVPRKSMTAIVMLFRDDAKNSEKFVFPNITNILATIEGVPNTLYSGRKGGLTRSGLYEVAPRHILGLRVQHGDTRRVLSEQQIRSRG